MSKVTVCGPAPDRIVEINDFRLPALPHDGAKWWPLDEASRRRAERTIEGRINEQLKKYSYDETACLRLADELQVAFFGGEP
jgi:hypothetical protein